MATVGELVVNLTARTAAFNRGMQNAQRRTTRFADTAKRLGGQLKGLAAGFVGVAGIGGMAMMLKRNLAMMDATGKLADRIGITTEKLQGLRHAAEITGAGSDTLDKSLQFMSKTLGEAIQGIGEGKQALDQLGLSAGNLSRMRVDEAFYRIAERTRLFSTQAEKAFVATKLFGRSGMGLVNTLELGSEGLAEMQREAEKLGFTFSREMAKGAEDANDAITKLKETLAGFMIKMTAEAAPTIEASAKALTGLPNYINMANQLMLAKERMLVQMTVPFGIGGDYLEGLENQIRTLERQRQGIEAPLSKKRKANAEYVKGLEEIAEAAKGIPPMMDAARLATEQLFGEQMLKRAEKFAEALEKRREHVRGMIESTIRGGDGAALQLPGTAPPGSREFYSMMVRRGLQKTGERTNEQIAERVAKLLAVEEKTDGRIADIYEILADMGVIREVHF